MYLFTAAAVELCQLVLIGLIFNPQACSQKLLLGGSFVVNVDLLLLQPSKISPEVAEGFIAIGMGLQYTYAD